MRAVLALAVLLLCAWAGNRRRAKLEARTEAVAAIAADMRRLRDVMELTPMPIAEAAQRLHCGVWRAFIENLQNRGARQAWEEALAGAPELDADRDALGGFVEALRASEMQTQLNALSLIIRELEKRRGALTGELEKKGRLYTSLGVLFGLALALLVL